MNFLTNFVLWIYWFRQDNDEVVSRATVGYNLWNFRYTIKLTLPSVFKLEWLIRGGSWQQNMKPIVDLYVTEPLLRRRCIYIAIWINDDWRSLNHTKKKINIRSDYTKGFENLKKKCVLKTIRQKWKHFEEMFVRTLHYHQLNSSSPSNLNPSQILQALPN